MGGRNGDAWEVPRSLLQSYSRTGSVNDKARIEVWAGANPGEVACLVLAKAYLLESFHSALRQLKEGPLLHGGKHDPNHPASQSEKVKHEAKLVLSLHQALDQACKAASTHRSLAGAALAATVLLVCRASGTGHMTPLAVMQRQGKGRDLLKLLERAKQEGDKYWADPRRAVVVGEPFPWEVAAQRGNVRQVVRDAEEAVQRAVADDQKLLDNKLPDGMPAARSIPELLQQPTTLAQVRLALMEDCLPLQHRQQLFEELREQSGGLVTIGAARVAGQKVPRHIMQQKAAGQMQASLAKEELRAKLNKRRHVKELQLQQTASAAQQAACGGGNGPEAAPLQLEDVRPHIQQKLEELLAAKKGDSTWAVRTLASLESDSLGELCRQEGDAGQSEADYVTKLLERVKAGAPPTYRLPLPLAGGGGGSSGAGELPDAKSFTQKLLEHAEGPGRGAAREALLLSMPLLKPVLRIADSAEQAKQGLGAGRKGLKSGGVWAGPSMLSLNVPGPEFQLVSPFQQHDRKLLAELQQAGSPERFRALAVHKCFPAPADVAHSPSTFREKAEGGADFTQLDSSQFLFYEGIDAKLEAVIATSLPVSTDFNLRHPDMYEWYRLAGRVSGLVQGLLARATLGRHMLALADAMQQDSVDVDVGKARAVEQLLVSGQLGAHNVINTLEAPTLHDAGCTMVDALLAQTGSLRRALNGVNIPVVQCTARLALVLLAAEHAAACAEQGKEATFDEAWVEQCKRQLVRHLCAGLRQLSERGRLSSLMGQHLAHFLRDPPTVLLDTGTSMGGSGNSLQEALPLLGKLSLPLLAQAYGCVCLWVGQRFLDLADMDPAFKSLLAASEPTAEVTDGGIVQLTEQAVTRLVASAAPGMAAGTAPVGECTARLASYCLGATLATSCGAGSGSGVGNSARDLLAEQEHCQAWGTEPSSSAAPTSTTQLAQLSAAGSGREAGASGAAEVAAPGRSSAEQAVCHMVLRLLELRATLGWLEDLVHSVLKSVADAGESAARLNYSFLQDRIQPDNFSPDRLKTLHADVYSALGSAQKMELLFSVLHNCMLLCSYEAVERDLRQEISALNQEVHQPGLVPKQKAELRQRQDLVSTLLPELVTGIMDHARVTQESASNLATLDIGGVNGQMPQWLHEEVKQTFDNFSTGFIQCLAGKSTFGHLLMGMQHDMRAACAEMLNELQSAQVSLSKFLSQDLLPMREWAWAKAQLLITLLTRRCRDDPPASLARLLLLDALPRKWQQEAASKRASSPAGEDLLQQIEREEEEQRAKAAAAAEKKRLKRQAQKAKQAAAAAEAAAAIEKAKQEEAAAAAAQRMKQQQQQQGKAAAGRQGQGKAAPARHEAAQPSRAECTEAAADSAKAAAAGKGTAVQQPAAASVPAPAKSGLSEEEYEASLPELAEVPADSDSESSTHSAHFMDAQSDMDGDVDSYDSERFTDSEDEDGWVPVGRGRPLHGESSQGVAGEEAPAREDVPSRRLREPPAEQPAPAAEAGAAKATASGSSSDGAGSSGGGGAGGSGAGEDRESPEPSTPKLGEGGEVPRGRKASLQRLAVPVAEDGEVGADMDDVGDESSGALPGHLPQPQPPPQQMQPVQERGRERAGGLKPHQRPDRASRVAESRSPVQTPGPLSPRSLRKGQQQQQQQPEVPAGQAPSAPPAAGSHSPRSKAAAAPTPPSPVQQKQWKAEQKPEQQEQRQQGKGGPQQVARQEDKGGQQQAARQQEKGGQQQRDQQAQAKKAVGGPAPVPGRPSSRLQPVKPINPDSVPGSIPDDWAVSSKGRKHRKGKKAGAGEPQEASGSATAGLGPAAQGQQQQQPQQQQPAGGGWERAQRGDSGAAAAAAEADQPFGWHDEAAMHAVHAPAGRSMASHAAEVPQQPGWARDAVPGEAQAGPAGRSRPGWEASPAEPPPQQQQQQPGWQRTPGGVLGPPPPPPPGPVPGQQQQRQAGSSFLGGWSPLALSSPLETPTLAAASQPAGAYLPSANTDASLAPRFGAAGQPGLPLQGFEPHPAASAAAPITHLPGSSLFSDSPPLLPPETTGLAAAAGGSLWRGSPPPQPLHSQPQGLLAGQQQVDDLGVLGAASPPLFGHAFPLPGSGSSAAGAAAAQPLFGQGGGVSPLWGPLSHDPAVPAGPAGGGDEGEGEVDLLAMLASMGVSNAEEEAELQALPQQPQQAQQAWPPSEPLGAGASFSHLGLLPASGAGAGPKPTVQLQQPVWGPPRQQGIPQTSTAAHPWASHSAAATAGTSMAAGLGAGDVVGTGLSNEAGEYNCFLNVVIQCLWHCTEFRKRVEAWPPGFYTADPVVHALRDLFIELAAQQQQLALEGAGGGVANPNRLREALAALPGQLFRVGEMNDAGELLLTVYEHVRALSGSNGRGGGSYASSASAVDDIFGLTVTEAVNCQKCGQTTHQSCYTQYFYNTQATSVRLQHLANAGENTALGQLLRQIERQSQKTCDTDERGCGAWNSITHFLDRAPRVFTLQLAWESHREEAADIAATLAGVQEEVDLGHIYHALEPGQHVYRLRSLVCYYGAHYFAFVLIPDLRRWLMFDDTRVSNIGTWADVRRKCELGRIQPSVLFYTAVR